MAADRTDTIAAIATAPGAGGIGVVRVSGKRVPDIAAQLLGHAAKPRHAHLMDLCDAAGQCIDTGLLLLFRAPASFTGEDVMELQLHGSQAVLRMALRRLHELGARPARAGEFSERAFLNGKLDLTQAEAIADLINAGSEAAARAAQRSLHGEFSQQVDALAAAILAARVQVEAAIDFGDEDIPALSLQGLIAQLTQAQSGLQALMQAAERGRRLNDGLHVVILGRPNVGKSSLLNALAADERAIVTSQAGTTRDILREVIRIDGAELTLVDTAGLRDSHDAIEREGIRRALSEADRADLIVHVVEEAADVPLERTQTAERLVVHNKIDMSHGSPRREWIEGVEHIHLSARSGAGLDLLRESLAQHAGAGDSEAGSFSARQRHVLALERALESVQDALRALAQEGSWELAAEDLRHSHAQLGEITGAVSTEDLLGQIFANFCIGK
ncbi:MAG: tRNA uridine-5-carboxymethylaminomethyl(34) synthesis GTPase MnmE [Xanthomonadales bacterium]|nr:tRNA uridine-5-carboxymethylaminomethyl(34) synthesis GTPase MnmE [Xanthomonadales bacterium]